MIEIETKEVKITRIEFKNERLKLKKESMQEANWKVGKSKNSKTVNILY